MRVGDYKYQLVMFPSRTSQVEFTKGTLYIFEFCLLAFQFLDFPYWLLILYLHVLSHYLTLNNKLKINININVNTNKTTDFLPIYYAQ